MWFVNQKLLGKSVSNQVYHFLFIKNASITNTIFKNKYQTAGCKGEGIVSFCHTEGLYCRLFVHFLFRKHLIVTHK